MTKKVIFITYKLQNYRIPILNIIGKTADIELTVAHSDKKFNNPDNHFQEIHLNYKKMGPLTFYDSSFKKLLKKFDVVVGMFYLQNLSFLKLVLSPNRKYKLIFWGIGVRASYDSEFDEPTFFNRVRYFWAKRSDAMIFYTKYAKEKYVRHGFKPEKLFVMYNTVEVNSYVENQNRRKNLLFVGTLYKIKKIFELLSAYNEAKEKTKHLPVLDIVGTGDEYDAIQKWIKDTHNADRIVLHGAIYDENKLSEMFTSSIACLSPGQAGLSVLKSFGYGVPFITHKNAITGGERLNISHEINGILYDKDEDLADILVDISKNREKYLIMGQNAKNYYYQERSPDLMAQGFLDAVNYSLNLNEFNK